MTKRLVGFYIFTLIVSPYLQHQGIEQITACCWLHGKMSNLSVLICEHWCQKLNIQWHFSLKSQFVHDERVRSNEQFTEGIQIPKHQPSSGSNNKWLNQVYMQSGCQARVCVFVLIWFNVQSIWLLSVFWCCCLSIRKNVSNE